MWHSPGWCDFELLDASDGERLERWGNYILVRPDPQIVWRGFRAHPLWSNPDAVYSRSSEGGGGWKENHLPDEWKITYNNLTFIVRPTGFKHTGIFPEQAANWDWFSELIKAAKRPIKLLNLFAYTGGATIAAAKSGASVCHVDAARGMVAQAKQNAALSGLADAPIRYITDDCKKFAERELKRNSRYDAIIMDPPSYGRGPSGEIWKIEDNISEFVALAAQLLTDKPLFFLINSYTTGLSPSVMKYMLNLTLCPRFGGSVIADELGLPVTQTSQSIPCGAAARWVLK